MPHTVKNGRCPILGTSRMVFCGDEGTRTPDFLLAKQALSRLSYVPGVSVFDMLLNGASENILALR